MRKLAMISSALFTLGICHVFGQSQPHEKMHADSEKPIVIAVHEWNLKEGVDHDSFEAFILKNLSPLYNKMEGQKMLLMKGDRGIRTDKYAVILLFDSVETRDRIYPPSGGISEEFEEILQGTEEIWEKISEFVTGNPWENHTDYIHVGHP